MARYAYVNDTGTTTVQSSGGLTLRRLVVGSVPAGQSPAVVTIFDSPEGSGEVVADLQFGPSSDGYLGAGVYEFDATLANGLTVTQAQGGVSLTLIYE